MRFTKIAPCPRCAFAPPESATPTRVFRRIPENRRNQPLQFMAAGFVFYPAAAGGSRHCRPAACGSRHCRPAACVSRQRRLTVACKLRWGSGGARSGAEPPPAEAATPPHNPLRILRIRRTQPLQFMAAGVVCYSAAATGCRHCRPALPTSAVPFRYSIVQRRPA